MGLVSTVSSLMGSDRSERNVRVIHATTGEILRHLSLDPTRRYDGTGQPPGSPPRKPQRPEP